LGASGLRPDRAIRLYLFCLRQKRIPLLSLARPSGLRDAPARHLSAGGKTQAGDSIIFEFHILFLNFSDRISIYPGIVTITVGFLQGSSNTACFV
jgi:hypothetical protein